MKTKPCLKCKELKKLLREERKRHNDFYMERITIEDYRAKSIIDWIHNGTKPAVLSFTSGNERQIAYAIEDFWIGDKDRLSVKRPKKWKKRS